MTDKLRFMVLANVIFLVGLLLAACGNEASTPIRTSTLSPESGMRQVEGTDPFTIDAGESVQVTMASMVLAFEGVNQDSRCPSDVTCVTAGNAALALSASADEVESVSFVVTLGGDATEDFRGHTITVLSLSPHPVSTSTIEPHEYQASMTVRPTP